MRQSSLVPDGERATYESPAFESRLARLDPMSVLATLPASSVRLQQTQFNTDIPREARKALADKLPEGAVLIQYKDEEDYKARAADGGKILDWLSAQLLKP